MVHEIEILLQQTDVTTMQHFMIVMDNDNDN